MRSSMTVECPKMKHFFQKMPVFAILKMIKFRCPKIAQFQISPIFGFLKKSQFRSHISKNQGSFYKNAQKNIFNFRPFKKSSKFGVILQKFHIQALECDTKPEKPFLFQRHQWFTILLLLFFVLIISTSFCNGYLIFIFFRIFYFLLFFFHQKKKVPKIRNYFFLLK